MLDKNSLAFLLTTHAATTPRGVIACHGSCHDNDSATFAPDKRLHSGRHRATSVPTFVPHDSFGHHVHALDHQRPLTAYLRPTNDAPRIDRVRLRPLQSDSRLYQRPPVLTRTEPTECVRVKREHDSNTNSGSDDPIRKSSKFCMVDGCTSRAKHARRCWKHGGSVQCKVADCVNRAKSKGVCWSHGGGSPCAVVDCDTIAVSNGFCWAHGGGKRCRERGCSRPAYERTRNYCVLHYEDLQHAAATLM